MSKQHPTVAQNQAHRTDIQWLKAPVDKSEGAAVKGEWWVSEYRNPWNGQAIRKSGRMTGRDWHVFNAAGERVDRAHSLTWAKYLATKEENQ